MTPTKAVAAVIDPALALLASLGGPPASHDAARLLLAIAAQESGLTARYQGAPDVTPGPAKGYWQFEVNGVKAVAQQDLLFRDICVACDVVSNVPAVYRAIEGHDVLAAALARLLVWADPHPLPTTEDDAWQCYAVRLWRPGKPDRTRWSTSWATAVGEVP